LPDRVRARDRTVVIAAEQWLIVLRERDETVRCRTPREQRRADTEELRAVVDDPVAVAVEREEGLVATRPHPLHMVREAVGVDVERHAPTGGTELDAVPASVDDDRAALAPRARAGQREKQADQGFHKASFPSWLLTTPGATLRLPRSTDIDENGIAGRLLAGWDEREVRAEALIADPH
jgi:hypothetical protein